jgi:hypothetical protein
MEIISALHLRIWQLGWVAESHFAKFPCYPSILIIVLVQMTTVKSFGSIRGELGIALVLQSFQNQITRM